MFVVFLFAAGLLINPSGAGEAVKSALIACANSVIPSLFPFFVCSRMLIELGAAKRLSKTVSPVMKPLFGVGGGGALALVLGIISGYPIGAKTVADLVEEGGCSRSEGEKLLGYCNNSGPVFILGAIGAGILGNPAAGRLIYAAHLMSAFTIAFLMRKIPCKTSCAGKTDISTSNKHFGEILTDAVGIGAQSVFTVCGFVIIFAIAAQMTEHFGIVRVFSLTGIDYNICKVFVCGLLEPTGGCALAAKTFAKNPVLLYAVLSAILGWSGISVHLQVLGIIKKQGLSAKYYFLGKAGMTLISPVYTYALLKLFPQTLSAAVFAPTNVYPPVNFTGLIYFAAAAVVVALVLQIIPEKSVE